MKEIEKTEVDNLVEKVSEVIETHFSKEDKFVFEVNYKNYKKFKHLRSLSSPDGFISNSRIGTLSWGFWYSHVPEGYKLITFEEFAQRFIKESLKSSDVVKYVIKDSEAIKKYPIGTIYYPIHPASKKQGDACKSDGRFYVTASGDILNSHNKVVYHKASNRWADLKTAPEIFINGHFGVFFPEYVKFGCARINRNLFERLELNGYLDKWGNSNISIESITIGNCIFSKSQIKRIVDYYNNL